MQPSVPDGRHVAGPQHAEPFRMRRTGPEGARVQRRRRTDAGAPSGQPAPIGETLLAAGLIDRETLAWALRAPGGDR